MKKILVIDDEATLRGLVKKKLIGEGYLVETAKDGKEGLEKMKMSKPDLILLDIIMPNMGGFELLEVMNGRDDLSEIPVVIVSNSGQPVEIDKAKKMGVKDWIVKTEFDPGEVVKKVVSQIGKPEKNNK